MTDIQAIKERAEALADCAVVCCDSERAYAEDIPVLLKELAEAEGKLEAVEERCRTASWTEKMRGGLATDILAILGGSE